MKRKHKFMAVFAVIISTTLLPLSANASSAILKEKNLYELRTLSGKFENGFANGALHQATHAAPSSLLELSDGRLLVSDRDNHVLRLITSNGVSTFSGGTWDFDSSGYPMGAYSDGNANQAFYNSPLGMTVDVAGNIYVADSGNHMIRKIDVSGNVTTIAGTGIQGYKDGNGKEAQFDTPSDVAVDEHGNLYVTDSLNHVIRKIDTSGVVSTLNKRSDKIVEYFEGAIVEAGDYKDGKLQDAMFNEPSSIVIDHRGNLIVSDTGNQRIRFIDLEGAVVATLAGGGELAVNEMYVASDFVDGSAADARFAQPLGIHLTTAGELLIADSNNHVIRVLNDGKVTTLAGITGEAGREDGVLSSGKLHLPTDVIERKDGTIAIADASNNKIKIIQKYIRPEMLDIHAINVIYNGELVRSDVATQVKNGHTYLPLRAIAEALGFEVHYNVLTKQSIILVNDELKYVFEQGGLIVKRVTATDEQTLDITGYHVQNRAVVPIRFISEQLGYDVQWDNHHKDVVIRPYLFH